MEKVVCIKTEFIKLGQLLKLVGVISNGSEAKDFLEDNIVYVNGEKEQRRGRKIYPGYIVNIDEMVVKIDEMDKEC